MELQFHGANCITVVGKQARLTVDDNLFELGGKSVTKPGDIVLFTSKHDQSVPGSKLSIDQPGEYEVSGVSIQGIAARAHMDEAGTHNSTIYKIILDDLRLLVTGHTYPELSDAQLEAIGSVDVMFVPVGGHGFTLDPIGALKLVKKISPKVIIPTHYEQKGLKLPVVQLSLEEALKELAMEPKERVAKLKVKPAELTDNTQLIVLEA